MTKECYIYSFETVLPSYHQEQATLNDWLLLSHERASPGENLNMLKRFCLSEKFIRTRYFECGEVDEDWEGHEIYRLTKETPGGAPIEARSRYFGKKAVRVFKAFYSEKTPAHLIHVTCTGYLSPSPAQVHFGPKERTPRITHAYHMGCYASLPAIRMAQGLCAYEEEEVDIVHTEMCSLHLNPSLHTPEQMVVQSLFSDGHIKYTVGREKRGFKVLSIHEKLIPESHADMTWVPSSLGMSMTLSREVPLKIRDALRSFIEELALRSGLPWQELLSGALFAIHPGGPQIIEAVQKKLELKDEQVEFSHRVLRERGNMSSATLPHVWKEIFESRPEQKKKIVSLAFGPGLTIFGAIFEVED